MLTWTWFSEEVFLSYFFRINSNRVIYCIQNVVYSHLHSHLDIHFEEITDEFLFLCDFDMYGRYLYILSKNNTKV